MNESGSTKKEMRLNSARSRTERMCGEQAGTCFSEGLQSESNESRVERDARWRIRVVEQQRNGRGAGDDGHPQHWREKQSLVSRLVLEEVRFRYRNGHVIGAELLAPGRGIVVTFVMMGCTG